MRHNDGPPDDLRCPRCSSCLAERTARAISCGRCGTSYPFLGADIPVLVPEPIHHLARESWALLTEIGQIANAAQRRHSLAKQGEARSAPLRLQAEALEVTAALGRQILRDLLADRLGTEVLQWLEPLVGSRTERQYGLALALDYAYRDWSREKMSEAEIRQLTEIVTDETRLARSEGPVLVLGAGTGRLADELSNHREVIALDSSVPMASLYKRLCTATIPFARVDAREARLDNLQVMSSELTSSWYGGSRAHYLVADARTPPVRAHCASAVIAVYFSDVLPLSSMLPSIKRVVRPGGVFVHLGPLYYHHEEIEEHLTAEEFEAAFNSNGFTTIHKDRILSTNLHRTNASKNTTIQNLLLTLRADGTDL